MLDMARRRTVRTSIARNSHGRGGGQTVTRLATLVVTELSDRLGYFIAPKWRMRQWPLATHLRDMFGYLKIDCVLDVGANIGEFGDFLRLHVGYDDMIVSFEPTRNAFESLDRNARADDKWYTFNIGLGSENMTAEINVAANDRFSSLLEVKPYDDPVAQDNVVINRQAITVRRLDDWISEHQSLVAGRNIYMKVDTQGYDLYVLRGCGSALSRIAGTQSEVPFQKIYQGVGDYWDALKEWHDAGFDVTGMYSTNRDRHRRVIEFDCIMINRALAPP
jgi:FkbM family methyltransferase